MPVDRVRMHGRVDPYTWKAIASTAAQALAHMSKALHRIADALEARDAR